MFLKIFLLDISHMCFFLEQNLETIPRLKDTIQEKEDQIQEQHKQLEDRIAQLTELVSLQPEQHMQHRDRQASLESQLREKDEAQDKMSRSTKSWLLYFTLAEAIVLVAVMLCRR